jgi:hypothetical protein
MLLHMFLSSSFNDHRSFPFTQLRRHLVAIERAKRKKEFDHAEKLEAFAARKVSELDEYNEALERREEVKALVDSGKMTKEEFIANALIEPGCSPCSSSFVVNDKMRNNKGVLYKVGAWLGLRAVELRGAARMG